MNKSYKRRNAFAISIILIVLIVNLFVILFVISHLTYYKYNDWWINGNSISKVREKYGDFDIETSGRIGYYIYTDHFGIFPDHSKHYYMYFDKNGIIYKVDTGCQPGG